MQYFWTSEYDIVNDVDMQDSFVVRDNNCKITGVTLDGLKVYLDRAIRFHSSDGNYDAVDKIMEIKSYLTIMYFSV